MFAEEVMEGVCGGVANRAALALEEYTGRPSGSTKTSFAKLLGSSMQNFCHTLVEEHEEELKQKIMKV